MVNRRRSGIYIHTGNQTSWLLFFLVVIPLLGFAVGFFATFVYPPSAKLAGMLACQNGTLQTSQSSSSQHAGSVTFSFKAFCSTNGAQEDVAGQMELVNGLLFAVAAFVVSLLAVGVRLTLQPSNS